MVELDPEKLPRHVAVIMDGNGRWARGRLRNRVFGHEQGAEAVREIIRCCRKLGIPRLTLYAFSKENWRRPATEVQALWKLLGRFLKSELGELLETGIRVRHIGDEENIPPDVLAELRHVEERTANLGELTLDLAVNYGGRQEIVRAAVLFAREVAAGRAQPDDLTPERFSGLLHTKNAPDPDLVIRTGGELRVSNFLLWQIAYAELYVTKVLWPDFRETEFMEALKDYQGRERRFGMTGDQVRGDRTE